MIDLDAIRRIADIFPYWASRTPTARALVFEDRVTTYRELDWRSDDIASGLLALGLPPQSRIGFLGRNSDRFIELLAGASKANMVLCPLNWRLAKPELSAILADAGCPALIASGEYTALAASLRAGLPQLEHLIATDGREAPLAPRGGVPQGLPAERQADDDFIQLYTSGTTGRPKGVRISDENFHAVFDQFNHQAHQALVAGSALLAALPFFHLGGVNPALRGLAQGATLVILGEADPQRILRAIQDHRIDNAPLVPALIQTIVQQPNLGDFDLSSLRLIGYGASPISEDLLRRAQALLGCELTQSYGATETAGAVTALSPADHDPALGRLRSCGKPNPGVCVEVRDPAGERLGVGAVGEIVVRSPSLTKGYWNNPTDTAKALVDGWYHTGDAGYFDADGYLFIQDRIKDMIVSGAENVYPAEVENGLSGHPSIADVAVIGIPDAAWGEAVHAVVALKPGAAIELDELRAWGRERLAGYKLPKSMSIADALPRNPSGKILRRELRAPFWEGRGRNVN